MKKVPELLQHLERKHQLLERELGALLSQQYLTPEESRQVSDLKKRKLVAKDGITALRQRMARQQMTNQPMASL
jgi:hypothetical protein